MIKFLENIKSLYLNAKRTALLAQENQTGKWFHLYSVIEILPKDIPTYNIPGKGWHKNIVRAEGSSKNDLYTFYLMVNDLDIIDEACSIFETPFAKNIIEKEENHFFNSEFILEPSPNHPLVIPPNFHSEDGISSIIPKRNSGSFVWSQIDNKRNTENEFRRSTRSKEMEAMSQLTVDWLGFDIWSKSEHLGNIYLVAPNPYFRDLDIMLCTSPMGIFYHFKMRENVEEKFSMRVIDKHGDYLVYDKAFHLDTLIGILELPQEPQFLELRIYNANGDIIAMHGPSAFLRKITVNMSMKQADFHVKIENKSGVNEFVVEKYSADNPINIGQTTSFNPAYFFTEAKNKRDHIVLEKNKEFIFFKGGKTDIEKVSLKTKAKNVIREIINTSRENCFLCDPYFNVDDLIEYAFYIKNSGVNLKIMNAKGSSFIDKNKAKELILAIKEYNTKPFQKIDCRLLRGDSILHDRFIISDRNVWYLGSSFNEFGNRATCLAKVPGSIDQEIIKEIEKWYYDEVYTQSLEDYVNIDE